MSSLSSHHRIDVHEHGSVVVSADIPSQTVVMTVRGAWNPALNMRVNKSVAKCMSEHPGVLIIDLGALQDPAAASVNAWIHAWRVGQAMEPPVQVLICAPADTVPARRLHRIGAARYVPVFDTVDRARRVRVSLADRMPKLLLRLPPRADAVFLSRNLVTDACAAWGLEELADRARLVVSELAGNAVLHGSPPITVSVSRRGSGIHVIVGDRDPRMPQVLAVRCPADDGAGPPISTARDIGQGLRVVEAAATSWGVLPTSGGKMVWATLYPWLRRR
ncbi:ATP-binding protein [Actinoplanes sp. NPDC049548]|uniref:ATP-binding protein n=1 Tax=Actinoplanes sp. NPDC049548 TaxID=3155152 RepID=UPI0034349109